MIGVLIVTHGEIGTALLESARQILDVEVRQVATLSVWRQDDPDDLILRARELVEGIDAGDGVLVLTDIIGGTPCNASLLCSRASKCPMEVVSGANLPMLLSALSYRDRLSLEELATKACEDGKKSMLRVSAMIKNADSAAAR